MDLLQRQRSLASKSHENLEIFFGKSPRHHLRIDIDNAHDFVLIHQRHAHRRTNIVDDDRIRRRKSFILERIGR